mgnify:CR=1 FL=1
MNARPALHSRRSFLKTTAVGLAALASTGRVRGANDDIRAAVIGTGGKGGQHVRVFNGLPGVRLVAICDVDPERLADRAKGLDGVSTYTDPREVIDRNDIDLVAIATPDHWHALLAIRACQSGKDVYVEKPVSHNIWEGRQIVNAAKKYKRIVQAGTQYRSCVGLREAADYIGQGNLGKMLWGHVLWYERRGSIGKVAPYMPDSLDYDLYCGPAPLKPLCRERLHYDWHWVWSTGTGDLGNSGIHAFDVCRWFAGYRDMPERAVCFGGRFAVDDAGETPNTQFTVLDYKPAPIFIENRNLPTRKDANSMDQVLGIREGVIFQCEDGYFAGFRGGGWAYDNEGRKIRQFKGDGGDQHHQNFIRAVRSRDPKLLNAPIEQGHISSACCHLGNLSFQLGSLAAPSELTQAVEDFDLAGEITERLQRHLAANEVNLIRNRMTLGPWLTIDLETETFTNVRGHSSAGKLERANGLARGFYREPFVVPEIA